MKSRIQHIEIQNFKAFRQFSLDLEGRHLLVYGANGSGKSSLYWALYTFLQSARKKPEHYIAKYFDPSHRQNLLNIYEDSTERPGEISLTLRDSKTKTDTTCRINQNDHGTFNHPDILKGNLASDFITYRFFFGFSHFRNSEKFDLWPLFEKEILPFCVSPLLSGGVTPLDTWEAIKDEEPNPYSSRGLGGAYAYENFIQKVNWFARILSDVVESISSEAQKFYDKNFSENDPVKVNLKLGVTTLPSAVGSNQDNFIFTRPTLEFGIQIENSEIYRPQSFLNEAKLTQLALSVRFAASLVNLHDSDLKLLVLDDLLVSLDMSNRMKVVKILLSEQFSDYQKIIFTHDLGFFREFQREIASDHTDWCFKRFKGDARIGIEVEDQKTPTAKAEGYLYGHDLEEAAVFLRKAAEDAAHRFRKIKLGEDLSPEEFRPLTENLKAARTNIRNRIRVKLYERILKGVPEKHRGKLICLDDADIDNDTELDSATKGKIKSRRKALGNFLKSTSWQHLQTIELLDAILNMTDRVLNPAAHGGDPELYESEVRRALDLIKQLDRTTNS